MSMGAITLNGEFVNGNEMKEERSAGLTVRCLLRLNRLDLAQNQVGVLKKMNEESVLTLLSEAALHLSRVSFNTRFEEPTEI